MWQTRTSAHPFFGRIGPDILNPDLSWRDVAERLNGKAFAGRALNSVYLDQAFLAGLGNYLRSEILFVADINPACKARELPGANWQARPKTLEISQRSYALAGVTLPERQPEALKKKGASYGKAVFVFGRASQPCRIYEANPAGYRQLPKNLYLR